MLFQWDCRNRNPVLLIATKSSTRKQVLLLKYCRNSAMLFQWDCRNRNPVLLIATKSNTYQEASIIEILCVETAQCYFNGFVETGI